MSTMITAGCVGGRHSACKGIVHYDGAAASDLTAKCRCRCHDHHKETK
jgi:hypothetical protein